MSRSYVMTASRISTANILWVEEGRQMAVDLHEPCSRAVDALAGHGQPAVGRELGECIAEFVADVHAVLLQEVVHVEVPSLQQQHDLTDKPVALRRREGPAER